MSGTGVRPTAGDAALAAAIAVCGLLLPWTAAGPPVTAAPAAVAVTVGVILARTVPLCWRRSHPLPALLAVLVAVKVGWFWEVTPSLSALALLVAGYSVAAWGDRSAVLAGGVLLVAAELVRVGDGSIAFVGLNDDMLVSLGVWGVGLAVRARRSILERVRRATQDQARADERARIARELHDMVAHHVSSMVVQAGAAGRVLDADPSTAREALVSIRNTGTETLSSLDRLVESLDTQPVAPVDRPSLSRLGALVHSFREAGLPVALAVSGQAVRLPPDLDLSAFRIVEESLTNSLKHARPAQVQVQVGYSPGALEVSIRDDGGESGEPGPYGPSGHGLIGMRERAALFGGELRVGPLQGGGWAVRAILPLEPPSS